MKCFEHQNLAQNDSYFEHHNIYKYIYIYIGKLGVL
jgi:hypothetical protein